MEFLKHYEKQERAIESRKMKKKIIWEEEKGGGAQIEFLSDLCPQYKHIQYND